MSGRLEAITLRGFRGATQTARIPFDPAKPITVIYGENGTGKSTIIDAIDAVCNRRVGTLADRASATIKDHLPAIGRPARDLAVELRLDGQVWTCSLSGRTITVTPGEAPVAHILRRRDLMELVEAAPAKRYDALRSLVDVAAVEACEKSLGDASRQAKARMETEARAYVEAEDALSALWQAERRADEVAGDPLTWADGRAAVDQADAREAAAGIHEIQNAAARARAAHTNAITALERRDDSAAALERAEEQAGRAATFAVGPSVELVMLLQQAARLLGAPAEARSCPVCERPVAAAALRDSIQRRLDGMAQLRVLAESRERATRDQSAAEAVATRAVVVLHAEIDALVTRAAASRSPGVKGLRFDWDTYGSSLRSARDGATALARAAGLLDAVAAIDDQLHVEAERLTAGVFQANAVQLAAQRVRQSRAAAREAEALHTRLTAALTVLQQRRKAYVERVLGEVEADCGRLYARIHPDEEAGGVRLRLDPAKRASLEQTATFAGYEGVPPQAYFSDSHLDTLGFCFWLAVAKYGGGEALVVLDDVFSAVDAEHMARIVAVLAEECAMFTQVILATHAQAWRDAVRTHPATATAAHLVELGAWSMEHGVSVVAAVMD